MASFQRESTTSAVIEQDPGTGGHKPGAETVGQTVDPGDCISSAIGNTEIGRVAVGATCFQVT